MEGSVGLPGDSPITEQLFNTGWGRLSETFGPWPRENYNPLCAHEKIQPQPLTV